MSSTSQRLLNRMLLVLGMALVVATGVVFVTHDGRDADIRAEQPAGPAKAVDEVRIKDFLFDPDAVTVAVGTKLTFTNEDSAPHTATSGASPNPDGMFDTDILNKGESNTVTLAKAGTFAYYCALHPFMKATVIVR